MQFVTFFPPNFAGQWGVSSLVSPPMHPELFKLPIFNGVTIFTYGALVAFGFLMAIFYVSREAKRVGEDPGKALDLIFWLIVSALLGSRIYYVLTEHASDILSDPLTIFKIWQGGLVFQGGVIAAFAVGIYWIKKHRLPVWKYMDMFAPAIALGHFFGRIGCFMAGCCHGRPADSSHWFTVVFPVNSASFAPPGIPLYPTQLMEAFGELLIFTGLFLFRKHKSFNGQLMAVYLFSYAILRFIVEFYRGGDTRNLVFGWFSAAQLISFIMVLFGAFIWIRNMNKERI